MVVAFCSVAKALSLRGLFEGGCCGVCAGIVLVNPVRKTPAPFCPAFAFCFLEGVS